MRGPILVVLTVLAAAAPQAHHLSAPCLSDSPVTTSASLPPKSHESLSTIQSASRIARSQQTSKWNSVYDLIEAGIIDKRPRGKGNNESIYKLNDGAVNTSNNARSYGFDLTANSADIKESSGANCTKTWSSTSSTMASKMNSTTNTTTIETSATSTTDFLEPTTTHKSLIPHWSYKKSSIAAATIVTVVAAVAFVIIVILYIKKLRRSWERYKREKREHAAAKYSSISLLDPNLSPDTIVPIESKSSRESLMFTRSRSPSVTFVVEETVDSGAVTRVYRTNKADLCPTLNQTQASDKNLAPEYIAVPERQYDPHILAKDGRAGSIPKPVVIMSPPLSPVESLSATALTQQTSIRASGEFRFNSSGGTPWNFRKEADEARLSKTETSSSANKFWRLPSIKKSTSPLFSF